MGKSFFFFLFSEVRSQICVSDSLQEAPLWNHQASGVGPRRHLAKGGEEME